MTIYCGYGRFDPKARLCVGVVVRRDDGEGVMRQEISAELQRIHTAINAGTVDKDTANEALGKLHEMLNGGGGAEKEDSPVKAKARAALARVERKVQRHR